MSRYLDLLSDLLLARQLQPFQTNAGKRLVKSILATGRRCWGIRCRARAGRVL